MRPMPRCPKLPTSLGEALESLRGDTTMASAFGQAFIDYFVRVKESELLRWEQAQDEFQRLEYFGRV